jgi:hypothetical protein
MLAPFWSVGLGVALLWGSGFVQPPGREAVPYAPKEGDLIFYDDHGPMWTKLFELAGTGPPLHMGIVVKKADGSFAVLEAGPDDTVWVKLLPLAPRLHQFRRDLKGYITIRRCKVTLSREKSAALTKFAAAQEEKRYTVLRLLAQGTWLRARGPLEPWLAKTDLDRDTWFCSELAVAAGTVAGLFDPKAVKANAPYPCDLSENQRHDLSATWEDAAEWRPVPSPANTAR